VAPEQGLQSVLELPVIALLGVAAGGLAALFTASCQQFAKQLQTVRPILGFAAAGVVTGFLAQAVPQIMGVGADTLESMLTHGIAAPLLLGIIVCKLLATAVAVGFRVPGGLIGPTLVIGGATGSLLHHLSGHLLPGDMASSSFYAMTGMVAMMGAALQAPMAALIALLELTGRPDVILPGMLAIVSADLVYRQLLGRESVFVALLRVFRAIERRTERS
jgi:H+/Cl- antiporter ClcA